MTFFSIRKLALKGFQVWRRYERLGWRNFLFVAGASTAIIAAFSQLSLNLTTDFQVGFLPAAIILLNAYLGAIPTLLATGLVAALQSLFDVATLGLWAHYVNAIIAMLLLRTRLLPPVSAVVYASASLALFATVSTRSSIAALNAELLSAVLNFSSAMAICALPWRTLATRRRRRLALAQLVFSGSLALSLFIAMLFLQVRLTGISASGSNSVLESWTFTLSIGCALFVCASLTRVVAHSIRNLATESSLAASRRALLRPLYRIKDVPLELIGFAATYQRRMRNLHRLAQRKSNDAAELRGDNERLRSSLHALTRRVQTQSQSLEQTKRDTVSVKDLQESLRRANESIEQIRRNRNIFIAMMSHEVRTPLHGLMSTLSLLREEALSSEGEHRLDIARTSARMLLKIANDILDLSHLNAGGFSYETAPFDPRRLLREIVEEFQATAQTASLELRANIDEDMPVALVGDRNRIHQIVSNLVTNALKFTQEGGVSIQASWSNAKLVIDVVDTGNGVPIEKRNTIFDSFVQAESLPNRRFAGTGLGLTIGRHLAEGMGGSLTLHDTGTIGSTFRLELALQPSDEPVPEEISARILAHPTGHILVVEDNDANQYVAKVLLESLECTVVIAATGAEALERIQHEQFDLVLMDCEMPEMDGYETARRMRAAMNAHVPIVAMTANALPEDKARCAAAGMDDFLSKPFGKAMLSKLLGQWLADDIEPAHLSEPPLDMNVFDELWESLHWRLNPLEKIYDAFVNNVQMLIRTLSALDTVSAQPPLRSLHTVRGSASMLGAKRIARVAGLLEHAAKNQTLDRAAIEKAGLPEELKELQRAVAQRLAPYASGRG